MGPSRPHNAEPQRYPSDDLAQAVLGPAEVALFESLYVAYHADARRMATQLLADPEQAADAVHNAYLEMLRYLLSGRRWYDPGDAKSVVLRNTRWAALKLARARNHRAEAIGAHTDTTLVGDNWAQTEIRQLCEQIVSRLRPRDQAAIHLHFVESLSHAEAGARMGISSRAFEGQLARALKSARDSARAIGARPALLPAPAVNRWLRQAGQWKPRALLPARLHLGRVAGAVTAAVCILPTINVAVSSDDVAQASAPSQLTTRATQRTSTAARIPLDGIADSAIVDVAVLPSPADHPVVVALGRGGRCACWHVFRSDDDGASWQASTGPTTMPPAPRVGVARDYPTDPRIFISAGSTGMPVLQSAVLGNPFVSAGRLIQPMAHLARASLMTVAPDRLLYVDERGVMSSSLDGGRTWEHPRDRIPAG